MLRQLMAVLVSTALMFGSVTSAVAAPVAQTTQPVTNLSPLPAGAAAGIKQAQGASVDPLLAIGIVAGIFLVAVLVIGDNDDDDNGAPSTTGSN